MRLIFGLSESSKSKHVVKGEATVDVLGMCIYASLLSMMCTKTLNFDNKGDYYTYRRGLSALLVLLRRANAGAQIGGMSDEKDSPRFYMSDI